MKHPNIYFLFLILLLMQSCGKFSAISVGEISEVSVKGFEDNALVVSLSVMIDNPTIHRIVVSDFDTKVFMNEQYIGKIACKDPIVLKARSNEIHRLSMQIRLANIFGTALHLMNMPKGQKVLFRLEGSISGRTAIIKRKVEVNESREITF
jgi:LEA14-like dessication related protein